MGIDKVAGEPESPISFRIDGSGVPAYQQIVHQVENALRLGFLKEGDRLPRVKDVVASAAINPNTVLKAYKYLELKGIAAGKPGIGTFITAAPKEVRIKDLNELRKTFRNGWLQKAKDLGLDDEGVLAVVQLALAESRSDFPAASEQSARA